MRCQSGRWTALLAVVAAVTFPTLTGCKSGTNLVSLPKMPSVNFASWGKKEAADKELAKKEAEQLPRPSSAALAGPDANALRSGGPAYPNTGKMPHQPVAGGYNPNDYTYPRTGGDPRATAPRGQGDYMSPAYARNDPRSGAGQPGGFYDASPTGYERTATRDDRPGGTPGNYDYSTPGRSYPDPYRGGGDGGQYRDSRATTSRGLDASPGKLGPNYAPRNVDSFSKNAGYDHAGSRMGGDRLPAGDTYVSQASDVARPSRGSSALSAGGSGSFPSSGGANCASDSCPPTFGKAGPGSALPSGSGEYRPFGTQDLDKNQWLPSRADVQPQPTATGGAPAPLGGSTVARGGYDSYRTPAYPETSGSADRSGPPRDSAFGSY